MGAELQLALRGPAAHWPVRAGARDWDADTSRQRQPDQLADEALDRLWRREQSDGLQRQCLRPRHVRDLHGAAAADAQGQRQLSHVRL